MAYYSGKAGVITINSVSHDAAVWSMNIMVEPVDVTNFLSSGCTENVAGLASMEITVSGPYTSVTALVVGASITVAPEVVTGTGFTTTARCKSAKVSTDVKGAAQFEAVYVNNGAVGTMATLAI